MVCSFMGGYRCCGGTFCLHFQGRRMYKTWVTKSNNNSQTKPVYLKISVTCLGFVCKLKDKYVIVIVIVHV
jgi:hypothetical protein